jgi:hypothetical protein
MNTKQAKKEAAVCGALMPPAAAADYLGGLVTGTLAKWRHYGEGPAYIKIGARVMYAKTDLDDWIASRRRSNTSEAA